MVQTAARRRWSGQFFSAQDALRERPPRRYIAKPLFPLPSFSMVYGFPGTFKTNLVIDLAACVMLGKHWLAGEGLVGYETTKSGVLFIDADSGPELLHERFAAALRAHGGDDSANLHYISFPAPMFDPARDREASVAAVLEAVRAYKAQLIVFDNLGVFSGGADENSSQMIHVTNSMREIATKADAAVVTIHHDIKNGDDRSRHTPRGHSSIEAALDLALRVTGEGGESIRVEATKTRNAPVGAFGAFWEYTHKKGGDQLERARFIGLGAELDATSVKAEQIILVFLGKNKLANQSQLTETCIKGGITKNRAFVEIKRMEREGKLKAKTGAHNQTMFSL